MEKEIVKTEVIEKIQKDTKALERKIQTVTIENEKDLEMAIEFMGQVKTRSKRLEEMRIEYTKPLNDHIKKINADFKKWLAPYVLMESEIKFMISGYRHKIEQERIALQAKLQKEAEEKARKEAKKNKTSVKKALENVVAPVIEEQATTIESKTSKAKFRKVLKFRIINEKIIPDKYWVIDEKLIRQDVSAGVIQIPGVEVYEEEVIAGFGA